MPESALTRARLALELVRRDPRLGGLVLRSRSCAARDAVTRIVSDLPRIHPNIADDALLGGLDLAQILAEGRMIRQAGLLAGAGGRVLTMAERISPALAGRLATALDQNDGLWFLALDEGASEDENLPDGLADRMAFFVDLESARYDDDLSMDWPLAINPRHVDQPPEMVDAVAQLTVSLGIDSARAANFTLRSARGIAALRGADIVSGEDLELACSLVLPHRATRLPEQDMDEPDAEQEPPNASDGDQGDDAQNSESDLPAEMLLEAVAAMIPPGLLDRLATQKARSGRGAGSGAARKGNRRGRPLPSRPGRLGGDARIDLVATLRAAAPWQKLRIGPEQRLRLRPSDIRLRKYEVKSDRLLIFAVDASGSAAIARLAEAKGAIEILLSEAYARRDHVALIGFRGAGAETLLPPTRSLVQTKRRLASLPGGGGTPLASGLRTALQEALAGRRHGMTPTICLMTDGRANIDLDGRPDRSRAAEDSERMAKLLRAEGVDTIVIDTGKRPERSLSRLADVLNGAYLPMPRADAHRVSAAVTSTLDD